MIGLNILKSKIHRAVVTETILDYEGSVTIDEDLMDAADLKEYEAVHIWNITNGSRLMTYALKGERGSGVMCINGAAAHLNREGDKIIVACFATMDEETAKNFKPKIVIVDNDNRIKRI